MKTFVPLKKTFNYLSLVITFLSFNLAVKAQTYTTIKNGAWSSASTWQGGIVPNAANIPATAVINIKHTVTYTGADINNYGTINIFNPSGLTPRLIVATGINFNNHVGGKFYITGGEYRQYRFVGGGETGVPQIGSYTNAGGYMSLANSYMEVANNFINQNAGTRIIINASITVGNDFKLSSNSFDTLKYSSVSAGMQGTGDFTTNGGTIYFQSAKIQVASVSGNFRISGSNANGNISYITLKNHVTNLLSLGTITVTNSVSTNGLSLDAYCAISSVSYIPNGKVSGTQTLSCSLNYFPAALFGSVANNLMNFSLDPVLIAGTNKQVGAQYKYEGIAPGIDAIIKIDSLVGGATIDLVDDNTPGSGFIEGFQPQIKSGSGVGTSYAVFTFFYRITGTDVSYNLDTLNITALDIDGNSNLKEFDQISMGAGATANYVMGSPGISLTQVAPGTFKGINIDGISVNGIDTSAKQYMFTVKNTGVSTFTLKMGMVTTTGQSTMRQYSIYMKSFVYPNAQTLPIKMESFTATLSNNSQKVDLRWTTTSEISVSHFVVEKSTDGVNFSDAGVVFANGNATDKTNYNFPDNVSNIQTGVVYYRIRSVDIDGKGQYSETRIIRISKHTDNNITIITYPNPVTNELRVTIPSNWQHKKVTYELFNANGQVSKKSENASSGQTETLGMNSLAPGFYIMRVTCNGETAQQKIIKQ